MIYLFDLLEFQVLAAAKGMNAYYGFPLEEDHRPEDIRYAVYQMARDGILRQDDRGMVIQQPYADLIGTIGEAETVTVMDRGQYQLPRRCVYAAGSQMTVMESSTTDPAKLCLSGMTVEALFQDLEDLCMLPEARLTAELGEYDLEHYWQAHIRPELWNRLMREGEPESDADSGEARLLDSADIYAVYSLRDKTSGQLFERLILIDTPMEYGMVRQYGGKTPATVTIEPYNRSRMEEILKNWWRITI